MTGGQHPRGRKFLTTEVIAKRFVMPECSYRASMISSNYKLDSHPETSRE